MGIDICLFAEKRREDSWIPVPEPSLEQLLSPPKPIDMGRNTSLFSLLHGSPIRAQGELVELPTIFGLRGFPKDMNFFYQRFLPMIFSAEYGDWGASWFKLQELIDLDWEQPLNYCVYNPDKHQYIFQPISLREYVGNPKYFIDRLAGLAPGEELRAIYWFNC